MLNIPSGVLYSIIDYMEDEDLIRLRKCCKQLNELVEPVSNQRGIDEWRHLDIYLGHSSDNKRLGEYHGKSPFPSDRYLDPVDYTTIRRCIKLYGDKLARFVQYVYDGLIYEELERIRSISLRGVDWQWPDYRADFDTKIVKLRDCQGATDFSNVALLLLELGPQIFKRIDHISVHAGNQPHLPLPFVVRMLQKYPNTKKHLRTTGKKIPELAKLTNIESLEFRGVGLEQFKAFDGIKRLVATNCNVEKVLSHFQQLESLKLRSDCAWSVLEHLPALKQLDIIDTETTIGRGRIALPVTDLTVHTCCGKFLECCMFGQLQYLTVYAIPVEDDIIPYEDELVPQLVQTLLKNENHIQQVALFNFSDLALKQTFLVSVPENLQSLVVRLERLTPELNIIGGVLDRIARHCSLRYIYFGCKEQVDESVLVDLVKYVDYLEADVHSNCSQLEPVAMKDIATPFTLIRDAIELPVFRVRH